MSGSIKELQRDIHETTKEKGFWDTDPAHDQIGAKFALIFAEVAEATEAYRKGQPNSDVAEELADVIIRCYDLAEKLGLDLHEAVVQKAAYNKTRTLRHGGRRF